MDVEKDKGKLDRFLVYLEHTPNNLSLLRDTLALAIELHEWSTVEAVIERAMTAFPDDTEVNVHAGFFALKESRFNDAIGHFQTSVSGGLDDPIVLYNLAYAQCSGGDYEGSLKTLSMISSPESLQGEMLLLQLRAFYQLERFEEAMPLVESSITDDTSSDQLLGLAAILCCDSDRTEESVYYANRCLAINGTNFEGLMARATSYTVLARFPEAQKDYLRVVELYPETGRAWAGLGQINFQYFEIDTAIEQLEKAVEYMADHIGTWLMFGWAFVLKEDYDTALRHFDSAYALDHAFAETHGSYAYVYEMLGEKAKAEKHSKLAQRLEPTSIAHQYAAIAAIVKGGNTEQAKQELDKMMAQHHAPFARTLGDLVTERIEMVGRSKSQH